MSQPENSTCRTVSWLGAIVLGVLGFLWAWKSLMWGFVGAALVGIVVFFVVGYVLVRFLCMGRERAAMAEAPRSAPPAPQPAPEAAPVAAPEPAAAVEPVPEPAPAPEPAPEPEVAAMQEAEPAPEPEVAPEPAPEPEAAPVAESASSEGGAPARLDAPRGGNADDLKKIKGIGPALEKQLNELGIWHFDQVAAWSAAEVAWIDDNLVRFKGRATRDDWVGQAQTLAAGGTTEFSARVDKGGVY
jgi:predicted flap endonuclease-1-like 5' DNA nuclease